MSSVQALRPNDLAEIGGYRLLGRLGEGGMGTVYLAESAEDADRKVALKVIRDHLLDRPEFRVRFRGEVERAKNVPPFCTAEVIDADPDHEPPYLVVEYVDGPTLAEIVRESGPLSGAALHSLGIGMATALTAIHNSGVVHRDLKPANVLLPRGGVKVIDFGLARETDNASQLTQTDQVMGTIPYISPERLGPMGTVVTPAADVFAWGAVMVYAATGHTPFTGDTPAATAVRIMTEDPDLDGLGGTLREIVADTLRKDPVDRPNARELLDRLLSFGTTSNVPKEVLRPAEAAQAMEPSVSLMDELGDTGSTAHPRRRRSLLLTSGLAVVAALAAAAVFGSSYLLDSWGAKAAGNGHSPAPTVSATDEPLSSPSPSPSATAPPRQLPAVPPTWTLNFEDGLTLTRYWLATSEKPNSCAFQADGMKVTAAKSYACRKSDPLVARDVAVAVRVKLVAKGTCGAVFLRYLGDKVGGYVLLVCQDALYFYDHRMKDGKWVDVRLGKWPFPAGDQLALNQVVDVGVILDGGRSTVFLDGIHQGQAFASLLTPGQTTFGILQVEAPKATYAAVFSDIVVWAGPPAIPSTSPSVSLPPSTTPSAKPSRSPTRSPSPGPSATS